MADELRVDAGRMIGILKARLTDEMARSAMFEAAYQDACMREQALAAALAEMKAQQEKPVAPDNQAQPGVNGDKRPSPAAFAKRAQGHG